MICEVCNEGRIESLNPDGEVLLYLCPRCMSELYPELCLTGSNIDYTF